MGGKRKENKQGAEMNGMEQKFKKEEGRKRCIHVKRAGELNIMRQTNKKKNQGENIKVQKLICR